MKHLLLLERVPFFGVNTLMTAGPFVALAFVEQLPTATNNPQMWLLTVVGAGLGLLKGFLWLREELWGKGKGNSIADETLVNVVKTQEQILETQQRMLEILAVMKTVLETVSRDMSIERISDRIAADTKGRD